eukprot:8906206-Pyramimonas_sp.AAC.1
MQLLKARAVYYMPSLLDSLWVSGDRAHASMRLRCAPPHSRPRSPTQTPEAKVAEWWSVTTQLAAA